MAGKTPKVEPKADDPPEVPLTRPKPRIEDHNFDQEAYLDDLTEWKLEQRDAKAQAEQKVADAKAEQDKQAKSEAEVRKEFEGKRLNMIEEGGKKFPDFEEVAFSVPIDEITGAMVLSSDTPAEIAYHLGKNPKEFERIQALHPIQRAFEIGKMQAAIQAAQKKTTNAPPPPNPVKPKATPAANHAKLAKENPEEYMRLRNEGKI